MFGSISIVLVEYCKEVDSGQIELDRGKCGDKKREKTRINLYQ